jgi:hypothetical protein
LEDSLDFEISSKSAAPFAANGIGAGGDVYGAQLLTSVQATPWLENVYNRHLKPINLDEYDAVDWIRKLGDSSRLRCFECSSRPDLATAKKGASNTLAAAGHGAQAVMRIGTGFV